MERLGARSGEGDLGHDRKGEGHAIAVTAVAVTVTSDVLGTVADPVMTPVEELSVNPVGRPIAAYESELFIVVVATSANRNDRVMAIDWDATGVR